MRAGTPWVAGPGGDSARLDENGGQIAGMFSENLQRLRIAILQHQHILHLWAEFLETRTVRDLPPIVLDRRTSSNMP